MMKQDKSNIYRQITHVTLRIHSTHNQNIANVQLVWKATTNREKKKSDSKVYLFYHEICNSRRNNNAALTVIEIEIL